MIFSLLIALLVSFQPTSQDTTDLNNLSVDKALEVAYQQNPRIKKLENQVEAQRQQQGLNVGINDPEITYAKEGIGQGTCSEQRWVISQSLDFPLTSYYRVKSAKASTSSLELKLQALKLQVRADVKAAYAKLAFAIESSHLAQERVNFFKSLRDAAKTRADLGESSEIDAMQASLQLTEAQNNMQMAYQNIMDARYNLFETVGIDKEKQTYEISFPDTLHYVAVDINQNEVLQQLQNHPRLQQINKKQRAASYQTKVAGSYYPFRSSAHLSANSAVVLRDPQGLLSESN